MTHMKHPEQLLCISKEKCTSPSLHREVRGQDELQNSHYGPGRESVSCSRMPQQGVCLSLCAPLLLWNPVAHLAMLNIVKGHLNLISWTSMATTFWSAIFCQMNKAHLNLWKQHFGPEWHLYNDRVNCHEDGATLRRITPNVSDPNFVTPVEKNVGITVIHMTHNVLFFSLRFLWGLHKQGIMC